MNILSFRSEVDQMLYYSKEMVDKRRLPVNLPKKILNNVRNSMHIGTSYHSFQYYQTDEWK